MNQTSHKILITVDQAADKVRESAEGTHIRALLAPRQQWQLYIAALAVNDALMIGLALMLAYIVRFVLPIPLFQAGVNSSLTYYRNLVYVIVPLWLGLAVVSGLFDRRKLLGGLQEYSLVFRTASICMLLLIVAGFLEEEFVLARGWLLLAWLFVFFLVITGRFTLRRIVYALRRRGYFLAPALVVGTNEEAMSLAKKLNLWPTSGVQVLGFVDDKMLPGAPVIGQLTVLGGTDQLDGLITAKGIRELILITSSLTREDIVALFRRYGFVKGLDLRLSSGLFEIMATGLEVKEMGYVPLVRLKKPKLTPLESFAKRSLDYAIVIPSTLIVLPFLLIAAIAVKLESPGPAIHRQRAMGINGSQFDLYKLRTWRVVGEQNPTRLGKLLRRLKIDELPQLINVLRGQMSLVGPSVVSPSEVLLNGQETNFLAVAPGMTGFWKVIGSPDLPVTERARLDMYYVHNWTLWLDLHLLFRTIPAVIRGLASGSANPKG